MSGPEKRKSESIIPQARLLRLLQIITVLRTGRWLIKNLAQRFDTSERTIYRYLKLLEEVDFPLEKDFENRYFIVTSEDEPGKSQFTIEEMRLMKKLIQAEVEGNPLKGLLLKKLSLNSEFDSMPRLFLKVKLGKLVEKLGQAIRNKNQVVLKAYHSANSGEVRDRLIEPFQFGDNYQTVFGLDTQDKICKQFKLDRIGDVIEMTTKFKFHLLHEKNQADIFGFAGDANIWVTLQLSMRAYLLLREEHPLSIPYTEKIEKGYLFNGPVTHLNGVTRFVLGLIDEIKVVKPDSLKELIKEKVNKRKIR
jgi:predicted DNA-binding transcriptional regulator YafY